MKKKGNEEAAHKINCALWNIFSTHRFLFSCKRESLEIIAAGVRNAQSNLHPAIVILKI